MIPKFRAWSEDTCEMVQVARLDFKEETIYYENGNKSLNREQELGFWWKPYVLMQSTGLLDKNGKEIFKGDIVKVTDGDERTDFSDGGNGTICGLDDLYMWYIDGQVQNGLFDINQEYYIEVIGNIYQNPELVGEINDL